VTSSALHPLAATVALGEELGRGGFGVVRAGRMRAGGAEVAVKVPHDRLAEAERQRILREAALAADLEHPRLTRLLRVCEDEVGRLALVYERVHGVCFAARLGKPVHTPEVLLAWFRDLVDALEALHQAGLVHRDLKPENVLVEPDGHLRLLDYGLLKATERGSTVTADGLLLGTPAYMAPELLEGRRATPATDTYALGCLLFQAVTGQAAFPGDADTVLRERLRHEAPRASSRHPAVSPALDVLLARALSRAPAERPPSPGALLEELIEALRAPGDLRDRATVQVATPPPARITPGSRQRKSSQRWLRRFGLRSSWPLVAVAVLAAGAFGWLTGGETPPATQEPTPSPEAPAGPLPEGFAAGVRAQLTEAVGWRIGPDGARLPEGVTMEGAVPLLDFDPGRWHLVLRHLTALGPWREWVAEDFEPERLGSATREELRDLDRRFEEMELPRPFAPFLAATPWPGPGPTPQEAWRRVFSRSPEPGELPARVGPWTGRTMEVLVELFELREEMREELRELPAGAFPAGMRSNALQLSRTRSRTGWDLVGDTWAVASNRPVLRRYFAPQLERYRELLVCVGQALRREPESRSWVAYMLARSLGAFRHLLSQPEVPAEPLVALGGQPTNWQGRAFLGELLAFSAEVARTIDLVELAPSPELAAQVLEEVTRRSPQDPGERGLVSLAWEHLFVLAFKRADLEATLALLERVADEGPILTSRHHLASAVLAAHGLALEDSWGRLGPAERAWLEAGLRIPAGTPDLDRGHMEEAPGLLARLEASDAAPASSTPPAPTPPR